MSFIDLHSLTVSNFNSALKVLKWRPASTLLWTSSCSYLRPITVQLEKHLVPRETPVSLQKSNCKSRFGETWRTPNETRNVVTTPFHISLPTTPRWLSWFPAAQLAERSISGFILIQSCIGLGFACRCTDYLIVQKKWMNFTAWRCNFPPVVFHFLSPPPLPHALQRWAVQRISARFAVQNNWISLQDICSNVSCTRWVHSMNQTRLQWLSCANWPVQNKMNCVGYLSKSNYICAE